VKPRPALFISTDAFHGRLPDVIVCPISSQPRYYRRPGPGDCPLRERRVLGLRHPSTVRVSKILAIDNQVIKRALGAVSPADLARVESRLRDTLGLG
jgi:mRNA-degrading endonuclease toxin of MazEF toxin-antitoxin module